MGRHTGDYLLGTTFLAVAMLLAMSQGKSESKVWQPAEHGGVYATAHVSPWKAAADPCRQRSVVGISRQPARAVFRNLGSGTRIVVGSLDVSGGRHAISVTVSSHDPVPVASLPDASSSVVRCSINDIRHWRNAKSLSDAWCIGVKTPPGLRCGRVCDQRSVSSPARVFLTPHFHDTGTVHEPARCQVIAETPRVRVYVDQRLAESIDAGQMAAWSEALASAAETRALPLVDTWIGRISDVDHDQKLSIVITDLDQRRRHATGSSPIHGCIRDADFRSDSDFCGDIVYVDPRVFELATEELAALLTHETAHAAVCSLKAGDSVDSVNTATSGSQPAGLPVASWLNEAVAHFVELQCSNGDVRGAGVSENFQCRLDDFLANPGGSPIVAAEDVLTLEERRSGSRGAATLFLARWFSSAANLQQFLQSEAALDRRIEQLAQEPYADVFRDWTLSLAAMPTSASFLTNSCRNPTLHMDQLSAADNHAQFSLLGTAFRCFECSADIPLLVIESDDAARLQISIIEPEARITPMATCAVKRD